MGMLMLSPAQIAHFHAFGFIVLRQWFTAQEVTRIQSESSAVLEQTYRDTPFDGSLRHFCCLNDDDMAPTCAGLLGDPRFFDVAEQLVGKVMPIWNDANRYVDAVTGWHPDVVPHEWAMRLAAVKFCHYLQPVRAHSGALRLIPGSHRRPYHDQVRSFISDHPGDTAAVPAYICETDPGDVVVFSTPTWHASVGGQKDRRLNTVAFYQSPTRDDDMRELLESLHGQVHHIRSAHHWTGEVFPREWLRRAASDPSRRRVVERMHSYGMLKAVGADVEVAETALLASSSAS
jgi:hypothetical protein